MTQTRRAKRRREFALVAVAMITLTGLTSVLVTRPADSTVLATLLIIVALGLVAAVLVALLRKSARQSQVAEAESQEGTEEVDEVMKWLRERKPED